MMTPLTVGRKQSSSSFSSCSTSSELPGPAPTSAKSLASRPGLSSSSLSLASPRQMRLRANSDCEMPEAEMENIEVVRSESREAAARLGCDLKWHHMTR